MNKFSFMAPLAFLLLGAAAPGPAARFTADGAFVPPADWREWVFLGAALDMSYSETPAAPGHSMFNTVYVDPAAWRAFKTTGRWPDGSVFILENRAAASHGSIARQGQYQGADVMGVEAHVRDDRRFKGGWGFFPVESDRPSRMISASAPCYACHEAHGAVDTTFTQFYPAAKAIAVSAGTYRER